MNDSIEYPPISFRFAIIIIFTSPRFYLFFFLCDCCFLLLCVPPFFGSFGLVRMSEMRSGSGNRQAGYDAGAFVYSFPLRLRNTMA